MKSLIKRLACLFSFFICVLCLTSCGNGREEFITNLVSGNIEEVYLGNFQEEYLEMVSITKEDAERIYTDGMLMEAENFAYYWGILQAENGDHFDDLNEELQNEIIALCKQIYGCTKYEISSVAEQDDGNYAVTVLVDPINIMKQAMELYDSGEYEPLNAFWHEYNNGNINNNLELSTEQKYIIHTNYTNQYAKIIVQMIHDLIPSLEYAEQQSQVIRVECINEIWQINRDDWNTFDSSIINYP